jgi:hypothetical protein
VIDLTFQLLHLGVGEDVDGVRTCEERLVLLPERRRRRRTGGGAADGEQDEGDYGSAAAFGMHERQEQHGTQEQRHGSHGSTVRLHSQCTGDAQDDAVQVSRRPPDPGEHGKQERHHEGGLDVARRDAGERHVAMVCRQEQSAHHCDGERRYAPQAVEEKQDRQQAENHIRHACRGEIEAADQDSESAHPICEAHRAGARSGHGAKPFEWGVLVHVQAGEHGGTLVAVHIAGNRVDLPQSHCGRNRQHDEGPRPQ